MLFVGDAKHTEIPGYTATRARLQVYLQWLSAYVHGAKGEGIFAICFGCAREAQAWMSTILLLAHEVGLPDVDHGVDAFGHDFLVAWYLSSSPMYR